MRGAGRDVWVKIRASEAERAEWHANACSAGLTLSDLVRRSVGRVRTWTAPAAEVERTRQVARIGSNLNQIARWANTYTSEAEAVAHLVAVARAQVEARCRPQPAAWEGVSDGNGRRSVSIGLVDDHPTMRKRR